MLYSRSYCLFVNCLGLVFVGLFHPTHFILFSCDLMTILSVVFWLLSLSLYMCVGVARSRGSWEMALIVIHKCWPCWTSTGTVHVLSVLVYRSGHHGSRRGWSLSIECALVQLTELSGNFLVKHGCPRVQNSWRVCAFLTSRFHT